MTAVLNGPAVYPEYGQDGIIRRIRPQTSKGGEREGDHGTRFQTFGCRHRLYNNLIKYLTVITCSIEGGYKQFF